MSSTERVIDRMNEPNASRSISRLSLGDLAEHVDRLGAPRREARGSSAAPVSGRASSREQPSPPLAAAELGRRRVAVAGGRPPQRLQRGGGACVVFSRRSSRTVEKRKISTARRTGLTRSAAIDGLFASFERVLDHAQIVDQLIGVDDKARRVRRYPCPARGRWWRRACAARRRDIDGRARPDCAVLIASASPLPPSARASSARKLGRHRQGALGDRQRPGEIGDADAIVAERGERVLAQGPAGDARW